MSSRPSPTPHKPGSYDKAARSNPTARRAKPIQSDAGEKQSGDSPWSGKEEQGDWTSKPWELSDKSYQEYNRGRKYGREDYASKARVGGFAESGDAAVFRALGATARFLLLHPACNTRASYYGICATAYPVIQPHTC